MFEPDKKYKPIARVLNNYKGVDYAFVFGSSTKHILPESDIDILIGGALDLSQRIDMAMDIELVMGRKADIVLAKEARPELVIKAFSAGVPVVINNKKHLKNDYFRNFYRCEDRLGLRRARISRIKREYGHDR